MANKWKIVAIIFIIIFILENLFFGVGMYLVEKEKQETDECYYNICSGYPQARYDVDLKLCKCYFFSEEGDEIIDKSEIIK